MNKIIITESDLKKIIKRVITESQKYSGEYVAKHIINITPNESDIPDYFIEKFIIPNSFRIQKINLSKLLETDPSFKEYFDSGEERYDQDEQDYNDIYQEITVFNGTLLDGYSRVSYLLRRGKNETYGFVNITNNIKK